MAKNWTVAEAAKEIKNGNKVAILDIGKRYPLFATLIAKVLSGDTESIFEFIQTLPDYNTANKINAKLKEDAEEPEDEEDEEEEAPKEDEQKKANKNTGKKDAKADDEDDEDAEDVELPDLDAMSAKAIYAWGKKHGAKFPSTKKVDMIAYLKEKFGGAEADDEDEEDLEEGKYDEMTAQELFKECKKRGIKVEPKKKPAYYIEKLEADDAANDEEEDDSWDDEEEEEAPKKADKKKADKKSDKKAAKKKDEDEEDDDDEWDI